jgi:hypothetical protein
MAASVGVMYLSTMAGDLEAAPLVMLATLLNSNSNLVMVENLMAAVWILLRNPHNRKILGTAFDEHPLLSSTLKGQMKVCMLPCIGPHLAYASTSCVSAAPRTCVPLLDTMEVGSKAGTRMPQESRVPL